MSVDLKVVNQWLLDFTVVICDANDEKIGTGFVVYPEGKIITCAHVVRIALGGVQPREAGDRAIKLYFPQREVRKEQKNRLARVTGYFSDNDEDVVVLTLDGTPPLPRDKMAVIGSADASIGHEFYSYGYRRLDKYEQALATGKIEGIIGMPEDETLLEYPLQLDSNKINRGMSGAAVLDTQDNLVVGIVSQVWYPNESHKDADTAFGVNARVLTFDPLKLQLWEGERPYPRAEAPQPEVERRLIDGAIRPHVDYTANMPELLPEWVGRVALRHQLSADYAADKLRVMGLIGFGGEGKTSLARKIVEDLQKQVDRIFWWSFYEQRSAETFFETALRHFGGEDINRYATSAAARAEILMALIKERRCLLVLDGFEVLQHEDGDEYGRMQSETLRRFLQMFAAPDHHALCLITSRAALLELASYTTYRQYDVDRLSSADGLALLRQVGVQGDDTALEKVVKDWDGHALTLSLIGAYLRDAHKGAVAGIANFALQITPATTSMTEADRRRNPYGHVGRILTRYDEHLTNAQKTFLLIFSAFRQPVQAAALNKIFRTQTDASTLNAPLVNLTDAEFEKLVAGLEQRRLLRLVEQDGERSYTTHPLIRAHYTAQLTQHTENARAHHIAADYYATIAKRQMPQFPKILDLQPYMEIIYHLCNIKEYNKAYSIMLNFVNKENEDIPLVHLGIYETYFELIKHFFPEKDLKRNPMVSDMKHKSHLLALVGFCLINLGRFSEVALFYERSNKISIDIKDWRNSSISYLNLCSLYISIGALTKSEKVARRTLPLATKIENRSIQQNIKYKSIGYIAYTLYLQGKLHSAELKFQQAEVLHRQTNPDEHYLFSIGGIWHAEYLYRIRQEDYAQIVTNANLEICQRKGWQHQVSQCHRVLGDLDADAKQHDNARQHYDEAVKIAFNIDARYVQIEARLARGRWYAKHQQEAAAALEDLRWVLHVTVSSGYRIYEADCRVALAWAYLAKNDFASAREEAINARAISEDMGYFWGKYDADEVLALLPAGGTAF